MSLSRLQNPFLALSSGRSSRPCLQSLILRSTSTSATPDDTVNATATATLPSRWLSDLKRRIGNCISFGLSEEQTVEAGAISKIVAQDWRELVAGSEGFLTGKGRAGFEGREVVWGEMDVMVPFYSASSDFNVQWVPANHHPFLTHKSNPPPQGHVNNVTYIRYAESGRVNWVQNFATHIDPQHKTEWSSLCTSKGDGMILRRMQTDYKFPMTYPDRISVYHKLRSSPTRRTDTFILDVLILSERHQRPAARCVEDIVIYDYRKGEKVPLRPFMVEKFRETFAMQEEARERNGGRVRELWGRVERLEKGSWDREGAVEDLGDGEA